MPRLLVSVRDVNEAEAALAGGADIIDIKEPTRGPLGMADPAVIDAIVATVAARASGKRVSAALGELCDLPRKPRDSCPWESLTYVKLGLAHAPHDWREQLETFDRSRFIAVAYADHEAVNAPPPRDVLDWAIAHRVAGILIDTAVKDGRNLFEIIDPVPFIREAREAGLPIALAGSLCGESLFRAVALSPDIIAVRGAACAGGDRAGCIDAQRVRDLRGYCARRLTTSTVSPAEAV